MNHQGDVSALDGFAFFLVHEDHEDLERVLHVAGEFRADGDAEIPRLAVAHDEGQPAGVQIEFQPVQLFREGLVVEDNRLGPVVDRQLDLHVMVVRRVAFVIFLWFWGLGHRRGVFRQVISTNHPAS